MAARSYHMGTIPQRENVLNQTCIALCIKILVIGVITDHPVLRDVTLAFWIFRFFLSGC